MRSFCLSMVALFVVGCGGAQQVSGRPDGVPASFEIQGEPEAGVPDSVVLFVERFLETLAAGDIAGALPYFDPQNREVQRQIGIDDGQYVAEGLGLHTVQRLEGADVPEPDPWDGATEVRSIRRIVVDRLWTDPDFPGGVTASGRVELRDGRVYGLRIFLKPASVPLGWQIAPAVG